MALEIYLDRDEAMALKSVLKGRNEEISILVNHLLDIQLGRAWNPDYDQHATCECGHSYYRHFDSYEDMEPVGCKYCPCPLFVEE